MTLTKFEQSGFILETSGGFRIAIDIGVLTPIERITGVTVDLMLVSHIHGDHFSAAHIAKLAPKAVMLTKESLDVLRPKGARLPVAARGIYESSHPEVKAHFIISAEGLVYEANGLKITCFHVDHGPNVSVPVDNFGFLVEADGQTIYFAGDMFFPSGIETKDISVDHLLLPVGSHYTFGPAEALAFAKTFKCVGTIVPTHYEKDSSKRDSFVGLASGDFNVKTLP